MGPWSVSVHSLQFPPNLFPLGPGLRPPDIPPTSWMLLESQETKTSERPVSAPELLGQSQDTPYSTPSPQPQIVSSGETGGIGQVRGSEEGAEGLPQNSQGVELKRWRKAKDYSDQSMPVPLWKEKLVTQDQVYIMVPCFMFPSLLCVHCPPPHQSSVSM